MGLVFITETKFGRFYVTLGLWKDSVRMG